MCVVLKAGHLRQTRSVREVKVKVVPLHCKQALMAGSGTAVHTLDPGVRKG